MHDEHVALDIVQDSMMKLTEKYADKSPKELPLLFQRILQNTIRDYYRRQKSRSIWITLFSAFASNHDEDEDVLSHEDEDSKMNNIETGGNTQHSNKLINLNETNNNMQIVSTNAKSTKIPK